MRRIVHKSETKVMTKVLPDVENPDQKSPESPLTSEAPPLNDSLPPEEIQPAPSWRKQQRGYLQAGEHHIEFIAPTDIIVGNRMRRLNRDKVQALKESIQTLGGIKTPLSVRPKDSDGKYQLVTGWYRFQAAIELGLPLVPVRVEKGSETDALLWEISENLHRTELSGLERDEHIDRWRQLTFEKVVQNVPPRGGVQPDEKGFRKTARELGVRHATVIEAEKVANLHPEVKAVANETGETSHTALMEAAKQPTPEQQIRTLRQRHVQRTSGGKLSQKAKTPAALKPAATSDDTRARFIDSFETLLKREPRAVLLDVISLVGNYPPIVNAISEDVRKDLVRKFAARLGMEVIIN
jgi:ParB-like nuclease family protein